MTVTLTPEKMNCIKEKCFDLLCKVHMTIHDLAEVIGLFVSSFPGVLHGPLFYRHLENDKMTALRVQRELLCSYDTICRKPTGITVGV